MPPMLKPPCSIDMVGRFSAFSTAMPWAFMATSMLPIIMPMTKPASTKVASVGASTGPKKARQNSSPVMRGQAGAAEAVDQHAGHRHGAARRRRRRPAAPGRTCRAPRPAVPWPAEYAAPRPRSAGHAAGMWRPRPSGPGPGGRCHLNVASLCCAASLADCGGRRHTALSAQRAARLGNGAARTTRPPREFP